MGYSPWGRKESDTTEVMWRACTHRGSRASCELIEGTSQVSILAGGRCSVSFCQVSNGMEWPEM